MGGRGGGSGRGGGAGVTSREYIQGIALEDKLFELHKNAFNALSIEEQNAIKKCMSFNGVSAAYKNKHLLDQAVNKTYLPADAILTRGVSDLPTNIEDARKMVGKEIGSKVSGKPISTSIRKEHRWGTSTIEIKAPKGAKGMYVEVARQSEKAVKARAAARKIGQLSGEAEYLLPSTTKIKITGVRVIVSNGSSRIVYDASLIQ